jgi:hypothetical protein
MAVLKAFRRSRDGLWTCIMPVSFSGPTGNIRATPGTVFAPGTVFSNVDLARWFDEQAAKQEQLAGFVSASTAYP